jgi:hypothetical protein
MEEYEMAGCLPEYREKESVATRYEQGRGERSR